MRSPRWEVVLEAAGSGAAVGVLPKCLGRHAGLREVTAPILRATPLFLSKRRPVTAASSDPMLSAIVARARDVLA